MPKIIATKEDWVKLGYKLFSEKGISGIVIESMAKKLKVNKSSFYWHFSTKKSFVDEIILFWENDSANDIISMVNSFDKPKEKFVKLVELSFKKDNNLDFFFYIKKYAKSNKALSKKIDELDMQRILFTQKLIVDLGYTDKEAKIKSEVFYKYLIGYHEMIRYKKQRKDYLKELKVELNQFIKF